MFVGILSWWYRDGWKARVAEQAEGMAKLVDFFSISLLLKTLFNPFRQISTGYGGRTLADRLRAFGDRIVSRLIGALVRTMTVFAGSIILLLRAVAAAIIIAGWAIVPVLPVIGLLLTLSGRHL